MHSLYPAQYFFKQFTEEKQQKCYINGSRIFCQSGK